MTEDAAQFDVRLRKVAVDFILPTGLNVSSALALAEDLAASGRGSGATVEVATMSRHALVSDASQPVRQMLAEHGIRVLEPQNEEHEYEVLLRAFGCWDLPLHNFEGPFYVRLPSWDEQEALDRALVQMLDRRDHEATPEGKSAVERGMRLTVRGHIGPM